MISNRLKPRTWALRLLTTTVLVTGAGYGAMAQELEPQDPAQAPQVTLPSAMPEAAVPAEGVTPPPPVAIENTAVPTEPAVPAEAAVSDTGDPDLDNLLKKIESSDLNPPATPVEEPIVIEQGAEVLVPQDSQLVDPQDAVLTPVPTDAQAVMQAVPGQGEVTQIPAIPAMPADPGLDENVFFDAESVVPSGEMGSKSGPKSVDPRTQPGSTLVVVTKNHARGSKEAQMVSADRAIQLGRYDSALAIYDAIYAKSKRDPNVLLGRAVALQHLGRDDEAIFAYEELLNTDTKNLQAEINMLGLMGGRYPAVALARLDELRKNNPENVAVVAQMAVIQASMGRYDDALQWLGAAAAMEPNNAMHLFNMAVIADRAGQKKQAIDFYEKALETDTIYGSGRTIPRDAVFVRLAQLR